MGTQPQAPNLRFFGLCRGVILALSVLVFTACAPIQPPAGSATPDVQASTTPSPTLGQAVVLEASSTPIPTATISPAASLYIPVYVPQGLVQSLVLPADLTMTDSAVDATLRLGIGTSPASVNWVYALVAPFPTTLQGISSKDLILAWKAGPSGSPGLGALLVDQDTYALFSAWWGRPAAKAVQILPAGELLKHAWEHQPAWALIPFEALEPHWKVLQVDGQNPLHNDFGLETYPLAVPFSLYDGSGEKHANLPDGFQFLGSNRDSSKLTQVALTGVTALVRGTALWMERYGNLYPAQDIGPLLRQADLTHISNEIPFVNECPFPSIPTPVPEGAEQPLISFCSNPGYITLLEDVGTDLVELTGDHFADWGDAAMQYTLELYAQHDLPVYGGGMSAELARQPLLIEHHGNKLAFLGCNIGWPVRQDQIPASALASEGHPGAAQCDFDWLSLEIPRLRAEGYQVIFTFQHREYDRMKAEPILVEDFSKVAGYGAAVVSGSQAHQPHGISFQGHTFIHYGLGNLFFDQYHFCADYACDYGFIDLHFFYDNRYLGAELVPIKFTDLAHPRLMTDTEQADYLSKIFTASGWQQLP